MKYSNSILLVAILALAINSQVQASIINLNGDVEIVPLKLDTTLLGFYNYGGRYTTDLNAFYNKHSANTGLETTNMVTLFMAEDIDGELGLFSLIDAPQDGSGGKLTMNYASPSIEATKWGFSLLDDRGDLLSRRNTVRPPNTFWHVEWSWAKKYADGAIFQGFGQRGDTLNINFENGKNINGIQFLSFRDTAPMINGDIDINDVINTQYDLGEELVLSIVTEPDGIVLLFSAAMLFVYTFSWKPRPASRRLRVKQ